MFEHFRVAVKLVLCLLMFLVGLPGRAFSEPLLPPGPERVETTAGLFTIERLQKDSGLADEVARQMESARSTLNHVTRDALLVPIHVVITPDRETFYRLTGPGMENSLAVSLSERQTIIINGPELIKQGFPQLFSLLVHEMAHVYLDVRCLAPVPRWLHEGVAQHAAGEWNADAPSSLATTRLFGGLIPLSKLENGFPSEAGRQSLAYQQSYSVVELLVRERFSGSFTAFLQSLVGEPGKQALEHYWSPVYVTALDQQWSASLGGWVQWVNVIAGSGTFWFVAIGLTFAAWIVRFVRGRRLRQEWDEEERILSSLNDDEETPLGAGVSDTVQEPWTDPEYEDVYEDGQWRGSRKIEP